MDNTRTIAIASLDDRGLEGDVSGHFGRCPFYTLVKVEGAALEGVRTVPNPHYQSHIPGVMPTFIQGLGADIIIAGGMGPRAIRMFEAFGIEVVTGAVGVVGKVLEAYLRGDLTGIVPCEHDHPESCGAHGSHDHGEADHG